MASMCTNVIIGHHASSTSGCHTQQISPGDSTAGHLAPGLRTVMFGWFQVLMRHCRISETASASRHRPSRASPTKHSCLSPLASPSSTAGCHCHATTYHPPEVLEQVRHGGACPRRIHARPEMGELLDQSFYDLRPAHLELNGK